jgi:hypothetical protein
LVFSITFNAAALMALTAVVIVFCASGAKNAECKDGRVSPEALALA